LQQVTTERTKFWERKSSMREQGVCQLHRDLAIYMKKYLKAKEELWKLKYFTMQKYVNLPKN
jgi:hypothetical protein